MVINSNLIEASSYLINCQVLIISNCIKNTNVVACKSKHGHEDQCVTLF